MPNIEQRKVHERDFRVPEFRHADPEDYEFRKDGKIVRKDRFETGFRDIVSIMIGPRDGSGIGFEIEEIVELVRKMKERLDPDDDDDEAEPDVEDDEGDDEGYGAGVGPS